MTAALPSSAAATQLRHRVALEGVRDVTPMVIGIVPFALAVGAAISASSLTSAQGLVSAPVILAGSAQLVAVQMLDAGTATVVVIVSAIVINACVLLYSAALAPWFRDQLLRRRLILALPVIDQMHVTCGPRFERGDLDAAGRVAYCAGAARCASAARTLPLPARPSDSGRRAPMVTASAWVPSQAPTSQLPLVRPRPGEDR